MQRKSKKEEVVKVHKKADRLFDEVELADQKVAGVIINAAIEEYLKASALYDEKIIKLDKQARNSKRAAYLYENQINCYFNILELMYTQSEVSHSQFSPEEFAGIQLKIKANMQKISDMLITTTYQKNVGREEAYQPENYKKTLNEMEHRLQGFFKKMQTAKQDKSQSQVKEKKLAEITSDYDILSGKDYNEPKTIKKTWFIEPLPALRSKPLPPSPLEGTLVDEKEIEATIEREQKTPMSKRADVSKEMLIARKNLIDKINITDFKNLKKLEKKAENIKIDEVNEVAKKELNDLKAEIHRIKANAPVTNADRNAAALKRGELSRLSLLSSSHKRKETSNNTANDKNKKKKNQ